MSKAKREIDSNALRYAFCCGKADNEGMDAKPRAEAIELHFGDSLKAVAELGFRAGMEAAAKIAEGVKGGFTANIRIDESEQELVRDKDGPWVLNSDVAARIRAGI